MQTVRAEAGIDETNGKQSVRTALDMIDPSINRQMIGAHGVVATVTLARWFGSKVRGK